MSVEFDTPANRIISQFAPKNKFSINTSLPDIAFMRQLAVQGRLVFAQGEATTAATNASIIPPNGTTFFWLSGSVSNISSASQIRFTVENDGMVREDLIISSVVVSLGYTPLALKMDALVGDGVKAFTIERQTSTTGTTSATIMGWFENTSRIRDVTP